MIHIQHVYVGQQLKSSSLTVVIQQVAVLDKPGML